MVLASGAAPQQAAAANSAVLTPPTSDAVRAVVEPLMHEFVADSAGAVPAVLIAVGVGSEKPIAMAVGAGDSEGITAADPSGRFRVGSVTKSFVAAVILDLVAAGDLALADTLDGFFPQVANSNSITIAQLLRHTSGMPDWDALPEGIRGPLFSDVAKQWTTDEIVDLVDGLAPAFEPGTGWGYSNPGFQMLTAIAESVGGADLATLVDERVVGPLGLTATAVGPLDPRPTDYAYGVAQLGDTILDWRDLPYVNVESLFSGAGAISSTSSDLVRFGRAMWGPGSLVDPALRDEAFDPGEYSSGFATQFFCPCVADETVSWRGGSATVATSPGRGRSSSTTPPPTSPW